MGGGTGTQRCQRCVAFAGSGWKCGRLGGGEGGRGARLPRVDVVRVRPHQVGKRSLLWHLHRPMDRAHSIHRAHVGREAAVYAEDLALDEGGERHGVKELGAVPPRVGVPVFAQALVIKAVDLSDLSRLVVPPQ